MPRRNSNASRMPLAVGVKKGSLSLDKFIEDNPTPTTLKRQNKGKQLPTKRSRKQRDKAGSQ